MLIGGAGLVGSHIVDELTAEPVKEIVVFDNFVRGNRENLAAALKSSKVRVIEGSMTDLNLLRRSLEGVDVVFLLASLWLGECVNDPRSAWETNVMGTWNVVEACKDLGIKRIVYSSSASLYGNALVTPMTEEHPFNNRTTYGATKIANEQMFRAIYEQHKLPYIGFRYMNIYGERMDYEGTYVSVIMKAMDNILAGKPPVIFGDGSQIYDFIYVRDVAKANVLGMNADCEEVWSGIGHGDAVLAATKDGALWRAVDINTAAAGAFAKVTKIAGATTWDANAATKTIVAGAGKTLHVSHDGGEVFTAHKLARRIEGVFVRGDGVIAVDFKGAPPQTSRDGGKTWQAAPTALRDLTLVREGNWIGQALGTGTGAHATCRNGVLAADGVSWKGWTKSWEKPREDGAKVL